MTRPGTKPSGVSRPKCCERYLRSGPNFDRNGANPYQTRPRLRRGPIAPRRPTSNRFTQATRVGFPAGCAGVAVSIVQNFDCCGQCLGPVFAQARPRGIHHMHMGRVRMRSSISRGKSQREDVVRDYYGTVWNELVLLSAMPCLRLRCGSLFP